MSLRITRSNRFQVLAFPVFWVIFVASVFGQNQRREELGICKDHTADSGKYKILSMSRGGVEFQIYLEISSKYRTDRNYVSIAREFKQKYCKADRIRIIYFASKRQYQLRDLKDIDATPLAIFFTGKDTIEREGLVVYEIFNGKVESRELSLGN